MTKDELKPYLDRRGFVFLGSYSDNSINSIKQMLVQQDMTDSDPDHVFYVDGGFVMLWDSQWNFDGPAFFERSNMISRMVINGVPLSNLVQVVTLTEYIDAVTN